MTHDETTQPAARHGALCFGEALWDALPEGLFLGGAPFNVACHLRQLGVETRFVSRVGRDRLGLQAGVALATHGLPDALLQRDPELETGFVEVVFQDAETPRYLIVAPAAWDRIEFTPELKAAAAAAQAVVFGSLAQRNGVSRATLRAVLRESAYKVYDVNLRPPDTSREIVLECLPQADLLKLNDEELDVICEWAKLNACGMKEKMAALAGQYAIETVVVTRGARGAALWTGNQLLEHPGFSNAGERVPGADPVGAGDAFLAGLLSAKFRGDSPQRMLEAANALGSYVAGRRGAIPPLDAQSALLRPYLHLHQR